MQFSDIERGFVRFSQMILQQDMLGGWLLISESGIQGEPGRVLKQQFPSAEAAEQALIKARDKLIAKGYKLVFLKGMDPQ